MQPTNSGNRTRSRKLRPGELWQVFLSFYMFQSAIICNDLQEQKKLCKPYNDDRFFLHVFSSCLIAGKCKCNPQVSVLIKLFCNPCVDGALLQTMCCWELFCNQYIDGALLQSTCCCKQARDTKEEWEDSQELLTHAMKLKMTRAKTYRWMVQQSQRILLSLYFPFFPSAATAVHTPPLPAPLASPAKSVLIIWWWRFSICNTRHSNFAWRSKTKVWKSSRNTRLIVHIESLQSNQCKIASKTIHVSCEENMGAYGSKVRESWKVSDPRRLASLLIPSWGECHRPCFLAVVPFASSPFFLLLVLALVSPPLSLHPTHLLQVLNLKWIFIICIHPKTLATLVSSRIEL